MPSDMNCLSVLQYAVEVLGVRHVIVVGHYGCGGVKQALEDGGLGMIDHWLAPVRRIRRRNQEAFDRLPSEKARWDRLCELNVIEQAIAVSQTTHHSRVLGAGARDRGARLDLRSCTTGGLRDLECNRNVRAGSRRAARPSPGIGRSEPGRAAQSRYRSASGAGAGELSDAFAAQPLAS